MPHIRTDEQFVSRAEIDAAGEALLRYFGNVLGRQQARSMAYQALVAARDARGGAKPEDQAASGSQTTTARKLAANAKLAISRQSPATRLSLAGRFKVD